MCLSYTFSFHPTVPGSQSTELGEFLKCGDKRVFSINENNFWEEFEKAYC